MRRFLFHTSLFLIVLLASFFVVFSIADGTTDAFYKKLSSPKQTSLIVGSSRAAQGIHPNIIDSIYGSNNIYNYSFTISASPYGKAYYESISKKLNSKCKNGVFIIAVTPWSLSENKFNNKNSMGYPEDHDFIGKTNFVNLKPNIEYLLESFIPKNEAIIRNKYRKGLYQTFYVQDNGWLEVTIESDMISKTIRTKNKIESYRNMLSNYNGFSEYRWNYLIKTINLFKEQGDVYLVRIPVIEEMLEIENELIPNFDERIDLLAKHHQSPYINMMLYNHAYDYTDGNHLTVNSGKKFSLDLAYQMKKLKHVSN
ncbi:hypothetical protein [Gelidibacter pelagius]|uniref:SGNH/GDSL hydrolase family protein n=1 Tax=Gelidibacter pelagius TaxID=2819985 RepID=A0ABS3SVX7_9FLAO|nr:hypothetical protein [Gelidibacter pelagius]MBO3099905.1 hypothetical protein [Gelidibacter pelagius]